MGTVVATSDGKVATSSPDAAVVTFAGEIQTLSSDRSDTNDNFGEEEETHINGLFITFAVKSRPLAGGDAVEVDVSARGGLVEQFVGAVVGVRPYKRCQLRSGAITHTMRLVLRHM